MTGIISLCPQDFDDIITRANSAGWTKIVYAKPSTGKRILILNPSTAPIVFEEG